MPDEKSPIEGLDGLLGDVYRDAKKLLQGAGRLATRPILTHVENKRILRSFHPSFADHDSAMTHLVDYVHWHETDSDWRTGSGLLATATYGELTHLWTRDDCFIPYEARLRRFIRAGGDVRRVFVLGSEFRSDDSYFSLYRALQRHEALRFRPKVLSVLDVRKAVERLDVTCDFFGAFHSRIGYFIHLRSDAEPLMLRTLDPVTIYKCQELLTQLWDAATPAKTFLKRHPREIPPSVTADITRDIQIIEELAHNRAS